MQLILQIEKLLQKHLLVHSPRLLLLSTRCLNFLVECFPFKLLFLLHVSDLCVDLLLSNLLIAFLVLRLELPHNLKHFFCLSVAKKGMMQ